MRALLSGLFVLSLSLAAASFSVAATAQEGAAAPPTARQAAGADLTGAELTAFAQGIVDRTNFECQVTEAAVLGAAAEADIYEVACASGAGMLLNAAAPQTPDSAVQAMSCLTLRGSDETGAGCTLTTEEENMAPFVNLPAQASTPCTVTDSRFVGATASGAHYFEYACEDGTGFMIQGTAAGQLTQEVPCAVAQGVGGGCTLVDVASMTANQNAEFTRLAAASGFECQVSRFAPFPVAEGSTVQASEIACENRPQSAVVIRDGATTKVMHCLRAEAEGFRCGFSQPADNYALLQEDMTALGRDSCVVNDAQVIGRSSTRAYVETTCADGLQGIVVAYPLGDTEPAEAITCSQATGIGGCRMAANQN